MPGRRRKKNSRGGGADGPVGLELTVGQQLILSLAGGRNAALFPFRKRRLSEAQSLGGGLLGAVELN